MAETAPLNQQERPRLGSMARPPSKSHFRIASSYNMHKDPIYDPVALSEPVPDEEELELHDVPRASTSGNDAEKADRIIDFAGEPDQNKIRSRRGTFATMTGQRRQSYFAIAPNKRRRSTALSQKPPNIVTWQGVDDPENPKNVSSCRWWCLSKRLPINYGQRR